MVVNLEVFTSKTCPHCPRAKKVAEDAKAELGDIVDVQIKDVDENMEDVRKYGLMSVPTLVINEKVSFIGAPELSELVAQIKKADAKAKLRA